MPTALDTAAAVKPMKKLHATTSDEILAELGLYEPAFASVYPLSTGLETSFSLNTHAVFIMLSMGSLWFLSAMPTMSPAYLAPPTDSTQNSSFLAVQDEVRLPPLGI